MPWIQIANRKINTDLICYTEEEADSVRVWFTGCPEVIEFHFDEAKAFWKCIKAEMGLGSGGEDKGFRVLEKKDSMQAYDVNQGAGAANPLVVEKPKPATPVPSPAAVHAAGATHRSSSHSSHGSHSSSHGSSHKSHSHSHSDGTHSSHSTPAAPPPAKH